ncbi:MAG: RecX family transcriptional regulator [bacterium]|nr:RecX family transcriptional regulator [bacterium]
MNIEKFTKKKDGFYNLNLDNSSKILIHEDLILKYDLLIHKEVSNQFIDRLIKENNIYLIYNKAIKYITIKMRSKYELEVYLIKQGFDKDQINIVIDKLCNQGYLNDIEFCKAYINDKINLSNDGPKKIISILKQNKINSEIIEEYISIFNEALQEEKINKLISKQIISNTNKGSNLLKQKILNNLINIGYEREVILKCLENFEFNDKELYKKEYNKLYNKLSKKYSGRELEYKIKQKLYQKGF